MQAAQHLLDTGQLKGKTALTIDKLFAQFDRWRAMLNVPLFRVQPSVRMVDVTPALTGPSSALTTQPTDTQDDSVRGQENAATHGSYTLAELTDLMLEESGYRPMWQADTSPEAAGRLDNLRELVRALSEFPDLAEFLEHVGLVTERASETGGDMVNIMSLHAAKGLEFDAVFLTGWEEGIFPSQRTLDELGTAGLEEERRLAYVGITRARYHLTICHAANRRIYNQWQSSLPSRFLSEIPADSVEYLDGGHYASRTSGPAMFQREVDAILGSRMAPISNVQSSARRSDGLTKGARVFHQKFGNGVILNIEGDHLEIAFKHAGVKKILAEYVEAAS